MAEIKKVVIEAGGKEFNLSVEEAKALRDILNATFKEPTVTYVPIYQPPIIRYYPPWTTWYDNCTVYCSTSNIATVSLDDMAKMTYTKEP
jgi:hypothetical protein